jgi:hypothetical protein
MECGSMMSKIVRLDLMLACILMGSEKEALDAIYDLEMRKFVRSFSRIALEAALVLVAYEKRFGTGGADIEKTVSRFNKMAKRMKIDTSYEQNIMASLLEEKQPDGMESR